MKNKKNIKIVLLMLIISIFFSFLIELLVFNRNVLTKNEIFNFKIIQTKGIEKVKDYYVTTEKESYLILQSKDDYINKINFDYKYNKNFTWDIIYGNDNNKTTYNSSFVLDKATKKVKLNNMNVIKIVFHNKNIKVKDFKVNNALYINWHHIVYFILFIFSFLFIIYFRKILLNNLDKAFLFISLICGIALLNSYPKTVYLSWDDQIHYKHAYYFDSFSNKATSRSFLFLYNKENSDMKYFQTDEERKLLYSYLNKIDQKDKINIQINYFSEVYKRIVYLPFYLGLLLSKFLGLSFTTGFILAKIFNYLVYVLLIYYAIKISTFSKKMIFAISLLESNLFIATSFSYDPTITASIILAFSIFLRILEDKVLNKKYLLMFIILIIWASLPKAIYCPLLLLLLFIPQKKFDTKKQAIILKSLIIIIVLLLMSTFVLPTILGTMSADPRGGNTSVVGQLNYIISNPLSFTKLFIKFFINHFVTLFIGCGNIISTAYLDSYITIGLDSLYLCNLVFLLYIVFNTNTPKKIVDIKYKVLFGLILFVIWSLIVLAFYLSFSEVGATDIGGVQCRYFLPLLLPALLIFTTEKKNNIEKNNLLLFILPMLTIFYVSLLLMIKF